MKISRQELERLIKEELREALEQYPADAMAEIAATIFSLADQAGVETTGDQREDIVGEIEELLRGEGFELREQGLTFAEPLHLDLGGTMVGDLMLDIRDALPGAWNTMLKAFERGGINTGLPLEPSVADFERSFEVDPEEDDEDLTSTIVVPPVSPPDDEEDEEDQTDTVVVPPVEPPPEDVPEEEEAPDEEEEPEEETFVKVGDVLRVDDDVKEKEIKPDFGTLEPGDYDVEKVWADERDLVHRDTGKKVTLFVSDIHDNSDVITINPLLPKIKNPWAFKYFWEEDDEEEEDQPDWMKKAVKGIKGVLGGSSTSIKVVGGLTGIAGIVGLMKYLAKDEEKVNEAAALKKGAELEELGELSPKNDFGFITSTLRFVLSLSLDKEHMKTYDLVAEAIRLALVWKNDPRSEEFDEEVSKALDKIPGIEWLDKFYPGGREKVIGVVRERWDDMTLEEKISLIVALLPQNVVERLEALIPGPDMSEMDMRWPDVQDEIGEWLATGELELQPSHWSSFAGLLFAAADMFGLLDYHQTDTALGILYYTDLVLQDAKDNSQLDRMTKIMDALFEHKKQLNRMKVLAGVK